MEIYRTAYLHSVMPEIQKDIVYSCMINYDSSKRKSLQGFVFDLSCNDLYESDYCYVLRPVETKDKLLFKKEGIDFLESNQIEFLYQKDCLI